MDHDPFRLAIEASPTGMLMVDRAGRIVLVNAEIERLFGYPRDELIGASVELLVPERFRGGHPGYRDGFFLEPNTRPMGAGRELYGLRKDGTEVPIEIGLNPLRTPDGDFVLSSVVDITERKRSVEQFRLAIEASPTGMLMVDRDGKIVLVNAQIEKLFGYRRAELIGRPIEFLVPERFRGRHPAYRIGFFQEPQSRPMGAGRDLYGLRKDGSEVPIEIGLNPLRTSEGQFVLSSIVDITERKQTAAQLFRLALEAAPTGMILFDQHRKIVMVNAQVETIFGYGREELIGQRVEMLVPETFAIDPQHVPAVAGREMTGLRKDGSEVPLELGFSRLATPDGQFVLGSAVDITERKQAATERDRFFDLSIDMLAVAGIDGYFRRLNPAFRAVLGYELDELLARPFFEFVHPDDKRRTLEEIERLGKGIPTIQFENRYRCKDGTYRWLSWRSMPDASGTLYAVARDVTDERLAYERAQASLREKEVLLQEVHHRVKNNLQVISSLMNMQLWGLEGPARAALEECRGRIQAIALIHERLYLSRDYARVPFAEYVRGLAETVFHAAGVSPEGIALELAIDEVLLPVDKAIPCGLVLNELIINALKHGFPNGRRGTVRVELTGSGDRVTLGVRDDGVGLPPGFDLRSSQTLGLQLIGTLAEQLEATLEVRGDRGAEFRLTFATRD